MLAFDLWQRMAETAKQEQHRVSDVAREYVIVMKGAEGRLLTLP